MNFQLDASATCDSFTSPCPIVFLRLSWIPPSAGKIWSIPSRPLDVYQNLKFNLSLQTLLNFSPFLDLAFFVSQKEWYKKCWIFNVSTASAIARMSSSFSGRNTMTSSNLTRNMTPLSLWHNMKSAFFFSAKSCLSSILWGSNLLRNSGLKKLFISWSNWNWDAKWDAKNSMIVRCWGYDVHTVHTLHSLSLLYDPLWHSCISQYSSISVLVCPSECSSSTASFTFA